MDWIVRSVYGVHPPPQEAIDLLDHTDSPGSAEAMRHIACFHWPARYLQPTALAALVHATPFASGLMWAMHAPQVHQTPALWDAVVHRLAHARCFAMLAVAPELAPWHRGVAAIYEQELLEAVEDRDDERLDCALRLCNAHYPPVAMPVGMPARLLREGRAVPAVLAMIGPLDMELACAVLRCPGATERTFRPLLAQAVFRQAVRELPIAAVLRLPTLCHAAADLLALPKDALLTLVDAYTGVPTVVRGQHHYWNMACLRYNMRARARGGSMAWTESPLATLYYMDMTSEMPRGPLARHRLLQVRRLYPDAMHTLGMDVAGYLLKLAMLDRRGANLACTGGAWQHIHLPRELVQLIIEYV